MHQYLDSDGSVRHITLLLFYFSHCSQGTSDQCVSSTIGVERLTAATQWLQANGLKAILGEIGAGSNDTCIAAVKGALCYMQQSGVWLGAMWWAAGPWWGTYVEICPKASTQTNICLPVTSSLSSHHLVQRLLRFSHKRFFHLYKLIGFSFQSKGDDSFPCNSDRFRPCMYKTRQNSLLFQSSINSILKVLKAMSQTCVTSNQ